MEIPTDVAGRRLALRGSEGGIVETEIIKTLNELHNSQIHFRLGKDAKRCRINLCGPAL